MVCSGYGKNGALSVLQVCVGRSGRLLVGLTGLSLTSTLSPFQKSIRPQVVTTFELPGCYDMWTVIAPVRKEEVDEARLKRKPRRAENYICST